MLAVVLCATYAMGIDYRRVDLADGFDYPVGKPNGDGYYKARGYTPNGHLGEDWNGRGGGDSDLGDPIYSTANGIVVVSQNIGGGWGNCIIVRHAYRDTNGRVSMVDSQYGHLLKRISQVGDVVKRGQLIATMGGNSGMYPVHLHFEMRKNLQIGMNRMQFARDNSNYYSPTAFIIAHRTCSGDLAKVEVPINNFAPYGQTLASVDTKPYLRRGYSIPVYRGPSAGGRRSDGSGTPSVPDPGQSSIAPTRTVIVPRVTPSSSGRNSQKSVTSGPAPTADTGGFWSRLKAKFKSRKDKPAPPPAPQR